MVVKEIERGIPIEKGIGPIALIRRRGTSRKRRRTRFLLRDAIQK
jgi:hypothetical protein